MLASGFETLYARVHAQAPSRARLNVGVCARACSRSQEALPTRLLRIRCIGLCIGLCIGMRIGISFISFISFILFISFTRTRTCARAFAGAYTRTCTQRCTRICARLRTDGCAYPGIRGKRISFNAYMPIQVPAQRCILIRATHTCANMHVHARTRT